MKTCHDEAIYWLPTKRLYFIENANAARKNKGKLRSKKASEISTQQLNHAQKKRND